MNLRKVWTLALFCGAAGAFAAPPEPQPAAANRCLECHLVLEDARLTPPARAAAEDVHAKAGFSCASCHGGDAAQEDQEKAHDRRKGFLGRPAGGDIPLLCGRCHADAALMKRFDPSIRVDQLTEYWTSGHGKKLREGDPRVANCASCHGAHGILRVKDMRSPVSSGKIAQTCNRCHGDAARMEPYHVPADIYAKYVRSVHFQAREKGDSSAPTCNSCHGNHGAAPPEVGSVANVCGTCHATFAEKFGHSPHAEAFLGMGLPACVTCHENHEIVKPTEAFLGPGKESRCASCHEPDSAGGKSAVEMRRDLLELAHETERARETIRRAAEAGMEVSRIRFELLQADEALTKARAEVHLFRASAVRDVTVAGLTVARSARQGADRALQERDYRQRGLFLSLGLIVLLMVALILKIRDSSRRSPPES
jgi:uncharacterized membrane protein YidH (DUF202 family)